MTDHADLVARLRTLIDLYEDATTEEAADAITALAAENARLRDGWARDVREMAALAIERDRLRADADALAELKAAAHGLSFGDDWNHGTQARSCGYRQKLLIAIGKIMGDDASPQATAALAAYERTKG